jgi:hypothetical protein
MARIIAPVFMMLALMIAVFTYVGGKKKHPPATISGTIRIVVNESLTHVIIRPELAKHAEADDQDTLLTGPLVEELRKNFQGRAVTLEGTGCKSPSPRFSKCLKPRRISID